MRVGAWILAVCVAFGASEVRAQSVPEGTLIEEPDAAVRMESWLKIEAERESAPALNYLGASALIGLGVFEVGIAQAHMEQGTSWWHYSLFSFGLISAVKGLSIIATTLVEGQRHTRRYLQFRRLRQSGALTDELRAMIEFEWKSEAMGIRRGRYVNAIVSFGLCALGGTLVAVGSQYGDESLRMHDAFVGVGATLAFTGCLSGTLSLLLGQPIENDVSDFSDGLRVATPDDVEISVTPTVSQNQLGIAVGGTF